MTRKRHVHQRFTAKPVNAPRLTLTGNAYLRYVDREEDVTLQPGDLVLYLSTERDERLPEAHYDVTGYAGHFRIEVYDGKHWHLVALDDFFPGREHHFRKSERPIDTYAILHEILAGFAGRTLTRTYREHYALEA